jgi:hypothetical protein
MKSFLRLEQLDSRELPSTSELVLLTPFSAAEFYASSNQTTTNTGNTGSATGQSQGSSNAAAIQAEINELTLWIDAFKKSNAKLKLDRDAWDAKIAVQTVAVKTEYDAYQVAKTASDAATKARADFEKAWENRQ